MAGAPSGPNWQARPDQMNQAQRYPLWRVSARGVHRVIVLSHNLVGCYTHFYGGRTLPCGDEECLACDNGNARRWHGWLHTIGVESRAQGILELTSACALPIDEYFRAHRTLRAAMLTARRTPAKPNGRVHIDLTPTEADRTDLPKGVDVRLVLNHLWEISERRATTKANQATQPQTTQPKIADDTHPRSNTA